MIRKGTVDDLEGILEVRRQLRLGGNTDGGFLLGSPPEVYRAFLADGRVHVLDRDGVVGFAVTLDDARLRASDLWEKRHLIRSDLDPAALESLRIGYFDQLGVLPAVRRSIEAGALAFRSLADLLADHDIVLVTTVREPVFNRAAWPFLARVGAVPIGRIDEVYPEIGALVSDVHLLTRAAFEAKTGGALGRAVREVIRLAGG